MNLKNLAMWVIIIVLTIGFPARGKGVSRIINQIKQKSFTKTTIGGCVIEKIENSVVISKENTK